MSSKYTEDKPELTDDQFERELFTLIGITRRIGATNSLELAAQWMRAIYKNTPSKTHSDAAELAFEHLYDLWGQLANEKPELSKQED